MAKYIRKYVKHMYSFIYLFNQKTAQLNAVSVSFNAVLPEMKTFGYWPVLFSSLCQTPAYCISFHLLFSSQRTQESPHGDVVADIDRVSDRSNTHRHAYFLPTLRIFKTL